MDNKGQPPPPGFSPPPLYTELNQQQRIIVETRALQFGPVSQRMTCPHCNANISTKVESEASTKTHLFALILCLIGCWPCAPCPYCVDSCLSQKHYCPSCNVYLGQYNN